MVGKAIRNPNIVSIALPDSKSSYIFVQDTNKFRLRQMHM